MVCGVLSINHVACVSMHNKHLDKRLPQIIVQSSWPAIFMVEVADTPEARARGLMGRPSLHEDHGMLFQYETMSRHVMWMKNTYVPLDILFIDDAWRIVGMIEHAEPLSLKKLSVDRESRYVFEMTHGLISKHFMKIGDRVLLIKE